MSLNFLDENKEDNSINELYEYQEYYLVKEKNAFKIIVEKMKNNIIIKSKNYEIEFNNNDLSLLTKVEFESINEAYEFIIDLFEDNKVYINNIMKKQLMKLILKIDINRKVKDFEIILLYNNEKQNINLNQINSNYNKLLEDIHILKEKIKIFTNKIEKSNDFHNNFIIDKPKDNANNIILNPNKINYLGEITEDSYAYTALDNTLIFFKSIQDILFLIYSNKEKSIITYDIINNKKIKEIKKAHDKYITNFRHYLNIINQIDLILSISLDSTCFLNDNNKIYLLTTNSIPKENENSDPIKIYDLKGNQIKELNDSNLKTFFIDIYYDNKSSKNYIITGNVGYSMSYDYNKNKQYHKYHDDDKKGHWSIIIYEDQGIIKLIESSFDGNIRIWNFHSELLLSKINVNSGKLYGICLLNENILFVGCKDYNIKIINLQNNTILKNLNKHNREVIVIKTINHPKFSSYIVSQGRGNDQIKLWKIQ